MCGYQRLTWIGQGWPKVRMLAPNLLIDSRSHTKKEQNKRKPTRESMAMTCAWREANSSATVSGPIYNFTRTLCRVVGDYNGKHS